MLVARLMIMPTPQLSVLVNRSPVGGTTTCLPSIGLALATNFTITAAGWSDPESDLPLRYRFLASEDYPTRPLLLLWGDDVLSFRKVRDGLASSQLDFHG
jgi:hypothetical protein